MKKVLKFLIPVFISGTIISCNQGKKLEEVVEVPLPEVSENIIGNPADVVADEGAFKIESLAYAYDALEPFIDAKTMEIHFSKHYLAYTNNLNKAIKNTPMAQMSIEDLLNSLDPENMAVRNNGGGFYNHKLFWEILGVNVASKPEGALAEAINSSFGSFDTFKLEFIDTAMKQFGSGWAWLVTDNKGKLSIVGTPNQDNPLMQKLGYKGIPVLGLDVWEHAYYLNYQNKRKDYVEQFFNVINWNAVAEKYKTAFQE
jgi:Fe-Mn family superoxide dismutase